MLRALFLIAAFVTTVTLIAQQPSGLDPKTFERTVRPQDDLFSYVNAGWIANTPMPPERVTYGTLADLSERSEQDLHELIEGIVRTPNRKSGSEEQQIADLYTSMMDEEAIEQRGAKPIAPELQRIAAITSTKALAAEAGYLSSIGAGGPFDGTIAQDATDPSALVFQLLQGGTLMSDRDYYLRDDAASTEIRRKYVEYMTTTFRLADWTNPESSARTVLALEIELARAQLPRTDNRDTATAENRFYLADLSKAL